MGLKKKKEQKSRRKFSVGLFFKEFVAGDIFLREAIRRQFLFVVLLSVLSLFYVNNRFMYERQLRELEILNVEVVDLRYRSLTLSKEMKQLSRRTMVRNALQGRESDLEEIVEPVVVIKKK